LTQTDFIVLDELGYLPFAQSGRDRRRQLRGSPTSSGEQSFYLAHPAKSIFAVEEECVGEPSN